MTAKQRVKAPAPVPAAEPVTLDPLTDEADIRTALGVGEGERHDRLVQFVGKAFARGLTHAEILAAAHAWAGRCSPPHDADDVERVVADIEDKEADRIDFVGHGGGQPDKPWPVMRPAAYHGLAGELVHRVLPQSEADPDAMLMQVLAVVGHCIGPGPHFMIEETKHPARLFVVVVGATAGGRKGTGLDRVLSMIPAEDAQRKLAGSLASGEGLVYAVRDPSVKQAPAKKNGAAKRQEVVDPGVEDKRLLVGEPEYAGVLDVIARNGNNLSKMIRQAWDCGDFGMATKNSPMKTTGAHVTIIANITEEELLAKMSAVEGANGFANRMEYALSRQSKTLSLGGKRVDLTDLKARLVDAVAFAQRQGLVGMDEEAALYWEQLYCGKLSRGRGGAIGKVVGRAAPYILRMALIYAMLDKSEVMQIVHVKAAEAAWDYSEQSAEYIFGSGTGSKRADAMLAAIRQAGGEMNRTELHRAASNHGGAAGINASLAVLSKAGRVRFDKRPGRGRPQEVVIAC